MADISGLEELEGFIGGCLVDSSSGLVMGKQGADKFDLDTAAAGNTEVVRAKIRTMRALGIKGGIEHNVGGGRSRHVWHGLWHDTSTSP